MNMEKYMTFTVKWTPCIGVDDDTMALIYGDETYIKCFKYGKNIFVRNDAGSDTVSAQAYLVLDAVHPKDLLDGQVVKSVNNYPESWDNRVNLYECLTWNE